MRVRDHREIPREVDSSDKDRSRVPVVTVLAREVNPRIVVSFGVFLESKPLFNIFPVGGVLGDQRHALLSIQFECKLSTRFHRTDTPSQWEIVNPRGVVPGNNRRSTNIPSNFPDCACS